MAEPYYEDDKVTLFHGDCLEVLQTLPDASVDAVVTDPPYGLEFMGKDWDAPWQKGTNVNADAGFSDVAMSDGFKRLPRPSFTGSTNPVCLNCGGKQRGRKDETAIVRVRLHGAPYKGESGTVADPTRMPMRSHDQWPVWVHPDRDPARFVGFETHEVEEASDE